MRERSRPKSGARSRIVTEPNVEDRNGSFSTRHISASASLIRRSATATFDAGRSSATGQACHDFTGSLRRTLPIRKGEHRGTDRVRNRPEPLPALGPRRRRPDRHADDARFARRRARRRLRAEAQQLRPRRRHRALRRHAAAALRAPRREGGRRHRGNRGSGRCREHRCSAPARTSRCSPARPTATRSTSASSPTRRATPIEDATANSGQTWIAAVNGTAAGGGYELALACDEIILVDDRSSAVSLPEVPLLAVLPGTGGLTRLVDKRHVRRDLADVFATRAEGVKGQQAVDWGLVDAVAPRSGFDAAVRERALARAERSARPDGERRCDVHAAGCRGRRRLDALRVGDRRDRPPARRRPHHGARRPAKPNRRPPTGCSRPAPTRGRSPPPASSTTPSCACASTSRRSAPGCCTRRATRLPSTAPRTCSAPTPSTGSSTRCAATGHGSSSASTSRRGRSSRWSSRAAASPACSPSWRSPPTARSCSTGRTPRARSPRRRCASPPPTTAGSRWPTGSAGWRRGSGGGPESWRTCAADSARTCSPPMRPPSGWSRSRPTTSTGTTRSA